MKIFYPTFLIIILLYSCNEKDQIKSNYKDSVAINTQLKDKPKVDILNIQDSTLNENLLGVWGIIGEHKASFIMDRKQIFYPEKDVYYSYKITKDSINIIYEDFDATFKINLNKSNDTLILIGDETHKFRRLEN